MCLMNFLLISAIQSANRAGPVLSCSAIRIYNSLDALTYRTALVVCTHRRMRVRIYVRVRLHGHLVSYPLHRGSCRHGKY